MSTSYSVLPAAADDPLVTIAIPTFNRASLLKDCVLAALSQTYQNFEILVSDNASTDETEEVLREFTDRRLRVVRQKTNIGLLPNWNACLAEAKGDYIVFVSDDDRIAPWMLERCIALVKSDLQISIVIALSDTHSIEMAKTWPGATSRQLATGIWDGSDILTEYLNDQIHTAMCSIVIRTDSLRSNGGLPTDFPHAADVAAWAPLLLRGKAGLVNESCATIFFHSNRETGSLKIDQLLRDGWKVADLISNIADHSIDDPRKRHRIQLQSRRCFARRAVMIFIRYHAAGGRLAEVLPLIWHFRRDLSYIRISDVFGLARPIGVVLLPKRVADWIRQLLRLRDEARYFAANTFRKPHLYNLNTPERVGCVYNEPTDMCSTDRLMLYAVVRGLRPKWGLEIGVRWGGSARIITNAMEENGIGQLVGIDPIPEALRAKPAELHGRYTIIKGYSPDVIPEAVKKLGGAVDFVFIDALHIYDAVLKDFRGVLPYLGDGAHILFHDTYHQGIDQAIRDVIKTEPDLLDLGFITRNPTVGYPISYQGLRLVRKGGVNSERLISEAYERNNQKVPRFSPEVWNFDPYFNRIKNLQSHKSPLAVD